MARKLPSMVVIRGGVALCAWVSTRGFRDTLRQADTDRHRDRHRDGGLLGGQQSLAHATCSTHARTHKQTNNKERPQKLVLVDGNDG